MSSLLRERILVFSLLAGAVLYLLLSFFEIPLWRCAWRFFTGTRCPGCGLTTGCKAILRGEFREGFAWNWFSPLVILGLVPFVVVGALPKKMRVRFIDWLAHVEGRFRLSLLLIALAVAQVLARIFGWA